MRRKYAFAYFNINAHRCSLLRARNNQTDICPLCCTARQETLTKNNRRQACSRVGWPRAGFLVLTWEIGRCFSAVSYWPFCRLCWPDHANSVAVISECWVGQWHDSSFSGTHGRDAVVPLCGSYIMLANVGEFKDRALTTCAHCGQPFRIMDGHVEHWRSSTGKFFCNEFCADDAEEAAFQSKSRGLCTVRPNGA